MKSYGSLRINLFLVAVILISGLVLYRLFILSVIRHSAYSRTAQAQSENINNILARGNIYFSDKDHDLLLAATNKKFAVAYVVSADIPSDKKNQAVEALTSILGIEAGQISQKVNSGSRSLKVVARRVNNEQVDKIKSLKIKGIGISYETDRYYPADNLGANILGFLGYDSEGKRAGQYGIESFYNNDLSGQVANMASIFALSDPSSLLKLFKKSFKKGEDKDESADFDRPSDLILTVDKNIQNFVQDKLRDLIKQWEGSGGTVIVQEPNTGKILAMADWPTFNPNNYSDVQPEVFLNKSIQGIYEPGSSFKPFTMAAGIDLSKITPQTWYEDFGFVNIAGYTIHNFSDRVFGKQNMTQVLEKSINTGTMFVENIIGDENFLNYTINLGFGQRTEIDLPGEVSGDITNLYSGRKINYLTASFGQGIAVTPLQLINAYSAIANGGKLMKPFIVDKIIKEGGQEINSKPEIVSIPISEKTAVKVQTMLVSVVDNGFDKARISGYDVAGKTGTAQIPDGRGGYSDDEFIHNFVGFAPAYNARFVILLKLDRPKGIQFASDSLSPTFREIASFLINYYNIPPSRQ